MRAIRKLLTFIFSILILAAVTITAWITFTDIKAEELPPLKNGDLVFQTTSTNLTWPIIFASQSLYTHMGIVKIREDGQTVVVEATGPVLETPINQWLNNGVLRRITIKRLPGLTEEKAKAVLEAAKPYYGRAYDFYFEMSDETLYCSELAYKAFRDIGISVGKTEKIGELKLASKAVKSYIQENWYKHPGCRAKNINNYSSCLNLILEEPIITPVAMSRDQNLSTVYTNFGPRWFLE